MRTLSLVFAAALVSISGTTERANVSVFLNSAQLVSGLLSLSPAVREITCDV
jgi:hypothetical protein